MAPAFPEIVAERKPGPPRSTMDRVKGWFNKTWSRGSREPILAASAPAETLNEAAPTATPYSRTSVSTTTSESYFPGDGWNSQDLQYQSPGPPSEYPSPSFVSGHQPIGAPQVDQLDDVVLSLSYLTLGPRGGSSGARFPTSGKGRGKEERGDERAGGGPYGCPFAIAFPDENHACQYINRQNISGLKEHLRRNHKLLVKECPELLKARTWDEVYEVCIRSKITLHGRNPDPYVDARISNQNATQVDRVTNRPIELDSTSQSSQGGFAPNMNPSLYPILSQPPLPSHELGYRFQNTQDGGSIYSPPNFGQVAQVTQGPSLNVTQGFTSLVVPPPTTDASTNHCAPDNYNFGSLGQGYDIPSTHQANNFGSPWDGTSAAPNYDHSLSTTHPSTPAIYGSFTNPSQIDNPLLQPPAFDMGPAGDRIARRNERAQSVSSLLPNHSFHQQPSTSSVIQYPHYDSSNTSWRLAPTQPFYGGVATPSSGISIHQAPPSPLSASSIATPEHIAHVYSVQVQRGYTDEPVPPFCFTHRRDFEEEFESWIRHNANSGFSWDV
ncbi:hypothetical protein H072_4947 [Dactylellina haptotyla CBS 200.50]|uniref:Uncharacterized protein n=1 Tax=Dactylellina haptotyla (strain CBS 200.50) TaxID=1284197 RepID=S8ADU7_DACHA|nr:hypothetical protein H072_4947 [Dactylellina haptotyla CBS 200.50]